MSIDIITDKTVIEITPTTVIYRTPISFTTIVVKVILTTPNNPRVFSYCEDINGQVPASLFLSEILEFIKDAKERTGMK